uniref:Chromomethylase n=1 Tax=Solanum tuberosum TaxID=4113 RepID=M1DMP3_SOLTU
MKGIVVVGLNPTLHPVQLVQVHIRARSKDLVSTHSIEDLITLSFYVFLLYVLSPDSKSDSTISSNNDVVEANEQNQKKKLLDLYSSCCTMSTRLGMCSDACSVKLVTKWVVDLNRYACVVDEVAKGSTVECCDDDEFVEDEDIVCDSLNDVSSPDSELDSTISSNSDVVEANDQNQEKKLLDLYSSYCRMSTRLFLRSNVCGVKLLTKWIVYLNQYPCDRSKFNHPQPTIRNETSEYFLCLLKEWEQHCASHSLLKSNMRAYPLFKVGDEDVEDDDDGVDDDGGSYYNDERENFKAEEI